MLTPPRSALVIIDVQEKLAGLVNESPAMLRNLGILGQAMRLMEIPVIVTEQYRRGLGPTVASVLDAVDAAGHSPIEKRTFSCCPNPLFEMRMLELHRTDIILAGIEAHVCVYQTASDLLAQGYQVHLVTDAVSSRTSANRALGIHRVEQLGGILTSTEMLLFELLGESGTDMFKKISALMK